MIFSVDQPRTTVPLDLATRLRNAWRPVLSRWPDLDAVYLFGSSHRGVAARDVDIALLVRGRRLLRLGERGRLCRQLEETSPVPIPVDLRQLTEDDPVFAFNVLKEGALVYEGEREERIRFEARVLAAYQDVAPMVARAHGAVVRRFSGVQT